MKDLNKVMLIGNLTRDPETRFTTNGQPVASFTVATNRQWKDQAGETKDAAEFTDIVAWSKLAEIVEQYVKKGRRVYVEGRLQTRSWEGQDGVKRNKTEVVASDVILLDRKSDSFSQDREEEPASSKKSEEPKEKPKDEKKKKEENTKEDEIEEVDLDDIPF